MMSLFRRNKDSRQSGSGTTGSAVLSPGTQAPAFSLPGTTGETISLADLRGRPVILAFYPADQSPVCSSQLALYNEALPLFEAFNARLLGLSVDDVDSHRAFARRLNLSFPLLADHDPPGAVARAYGVYDEQTGVCQRALFVLDEAGIIRWGYVSPIGVNPGADGILAALEDL